MFNMLRRHNFYLFYFIFLFKIARKKGKGKEHDEEEKIQGKPEMEIVSLDQIL